MLEARDTLWPDRTSIRGDAALTIAPLPVLRRQGRRGRRRVQPTTFVVDHASAKRRCAMPKTPPPRSGRAGVRGFADAALWARIGSSTFHKRGGNEQGASGNCPRNGCDDRGGARGPADVLYWRRRRRVDDENRR